MMTLKQIVADIKSNPSVQDKLAIYRTHEEIGASVLFKDPFSDNPAEEFIVDLGDDCAAIPDGNGAFILFAAEGIVPEFLQAHPWFAGYSAVMVNISDVCAMGGIPLAVTDVLWVKDKAEGNEIWAGMRAASEAYGVPIVGGHTCYRSKNAHLGVAIIGKAKNIISSKAAMPGDVLMMVIDLHGSYFEHYPFWNASTTASSGKLKQNMKLLYEVAERNLCIAGKDISMGGIAGTLGMLLNTSGVGAVLNLEQIPRPPGIPWNKWLTSFPSYGYLLTIKAENIEAMKNLFHAQQIACEAVGEITAEIKLQLTYNGEIENLY